MFPDFQVAYKYPGADDIPVDDVGLIELENKTRQSAIHVYHYIIKKITDRVHRKCKYKLL